MEEGFKILKNTFDIFYYANLVYQRRRDES